MCVCLGLAASICMWRWQTSFYSTNPETQRVRGNCTIFDLSWKIVCIEVWLYSWGPNISKYPLKYSETCWQLTCEVIWSAFHCLKNINLDINLSNQYTDINRFVTGLGLGSGFCKYHHLCWKKHCVYEMSSVI